MQAQDSDPRSTLQMYRAALHLRRKLQPPDNELGWAPGPDDDVLDFSRSNDWRSITNFSRTAKAPPPGKILFASRDITDRSTIPAETTSGCKPE